MFEGLAVIFSLVIIFYMIIECLTTISLSFYGIFTILKNCIMYVVKPKFRKVGKDSKDSKFILKAYDKDLF